MINIEIRTYIKITWIILHLTIIPFAFAQNVEVNIETDQDISIDLLFSPNPENYQLDKGKHTINLDLIQPIEPDIDYLQSDNLVDWNSNEVQKIFSNLEGSEEEKIMQAIQYIQQNIQYNLSSIAAEGSQKVSWVLNNKEGVCDEITATLIAAARLHNIPARFVHGYAYTTSELFSEPWQPHTWAEVYIQDTWTPIDITFNQYSSINKDHIPFVISNKMDQKQYSVQYSGSEPNIQINYTMNFVPENKDTFTDYNVNIPQAVAYSSDIPITLKSPSTDIKSVQIFAPDDFTVINPKVMTNHAIAWIIPPNLSQDYTYTIPIKIGINNYFTNHTVTIDATPVNHQYKTTETGQSFWCEYQNEVVCYSTKTAELCMDKCYTIDSKGTRIYVDHKQGMNTVRAFLNGEPHVINYYVPPIANILCNISNGVPTRIMLTTMNLHNNVNISIRTPFQTQQIFYDTLDKDVSHEITFDTYFDGMMITAEIISDQIQTECSEQVSIKVEGWDLISNFFYKIVSKFISYA